METLYKIINDSYFKLYRTDKPLITLLLSCFSQPQVSLVEFMREVGRQLVLLQLPTVQLVSSSLYHKEYLKTIFDSKWQSWCSQKVRHVPHYHFNGKISKHHPTSSPSAHHNERQHQKNISKIYPVKVIEESLDLGKKDITSWGGERSATR